MWRASGARRSPRRAALDRRYLRHRNRSRPRRAYLLGRGLLVSPETIIARSTPHYDFSVPIALGQSEGRADAIAGIWVLYLGFGTQALAYVLSIAFRLSAGGGSGRALIVLAFGLGAAVLAVFVGRETHWRRLRPIVVELARHRLGERSSRPRRDQLMLYGAHLGRPATAAEVLPGGSAAYAFRVFGLSEDELEPRDLPEPNADDASAD